MTTIRLTDIAEPGVYNALAGGLVAYNTQRTGMNDHRSLVLAIEDDNGQVVGGLWGRTVFGWLFIELVFVPESMRGNGLGAELVTRAEREALSRGCHSAWLDTFEFQARGFYERLGYSCFGELADFPVGFSRYFMKKTLVGGAPSS
jgi:GNAT superfamily N-acetyltransferase